MQFHHGGRQFFFVTIAIEGRERALSRLVDERSRPELLPCGEAVKAALVAMHGEFPCATVSDFVIMPDHVHFLLIVDYGKDPAFSPLWAAHRLMDATEEMWAGATPGKGGELRPPNPRQEASNPRQEAPNPRQEAPNPRQEAESPTGAAARALVRAVERARRQQGLLTIANTPRLRESGDPPAGGGSGAASPRPFPAEPLPRWDRHCYIELSFDARQLKAIRRYIRLNPARALWKANHPDRFLRFAGIRHPILDPMRRWDAMGDLTLLGSPFLRHIRLTMRKTAEEHDAEIGEIVEAAANGIVPVCGFISPGEKELLRRLKAEPRARFVKVVPFALPPRYDPSAEDSRELAADRLLILSGFPQGTADSRANLRARCNFMNDLAAALCARAQERG